MPTIDSDMSCHSRSLRLTSSIDAIVPWLATHGRRRWWAICLSVVMMLTGMSFMLAWNAIVHHEGSWATPGDMWGMLRGAHYVAWGYIGGLYSPDTGILTFPGMPILLAPVAGLVGQLHLTESFLPFFLPRPAAALIVMPVEILLASTVVFACDALADRLGVTAGRRGALGLAVACLAWPVAVVWGHAEDALAMTFACYALVALFDKRWTSVGWLLGVGILIQPLVALLLPLVVAAAPAAKRIALATRSAILSVVLIGVSYAGNAGDTYRALVDQPTPPDVNHATPWVALAPSVGTRGGPAHHAFTLVPGLGHPSLSTVLSPAGVNLVAGGPARLIDLVLVLSVAVFIARHRMNEVELAWVAVAALASRCLFEAVMTPYYLAPPLILALVLAARQDARRFWAAVVLALEVTVFAYHHLEPWVWWVPIVLGLFAIVALAFPKGLVQRSSADKSSIEHRSVTDLTLDPGGRPRATRRPSPDRRDHDDEVAFA